MQDLIPTDPETTKEMFKAIGNFLDPITRTPNQELGGFFTDKIRFWRVSQQLKYVQKLKEKIKKAGFEPKKLELKTLFPYLEGISLEEDEEMLDRWTDLMLNYVDPSVNLKLMVYPEILKQLSTPEIKALKKQYDEVKRDMPIAEPITILGGIYGDYGIQISPEACANLERLGLIREDFRDSREFEEGMYVDSISLTSGAIVGEESYRITKFGIELVKACTRS